MIMSFAASANDGTAVNIISDDTSNDHCVSAYKDNRFYVDIDAGDITDPVWTLSMPMSDGSIKTIALPDDINSCVLPSIKDINSYQVNSYGNIKCTLLFSCRIRGAVVKSAPLELFVDLKPFIESATVEKIVNHAPKPSYDAYYVVKYSGADRIRVSVEEEYGSALHTNVINEPGIASGIAENITAPYYAWIDFVADNEYGRSVYTIELGPYGEVLNSGPSSDSGSSRPGNTAGLTETYKAVKATYSNNVVDFSEVVENVVVYNIQGTLVKEEKEVMSMDLNEINSGVYIVIFIDKNNNRNSLKVTRRSN